MRRFQLVARISFLRVESNQLLPAAPFLRPRALVFVSDEILKRREEEGSELPALPVCFGDGVLLLEVETERLDKIFSIVFPVSAPADVSVEGVPISLEEPRQRFPGAGRIGSVFASQDHRPVSGIEIGRAIAPFVRGCHRETLRWPQFNNNDEGANFPLSGS